MIANYFWPTRIPAGMPETIKVRLSAHIVKGNQPDIFSADSLTH